MQAPPEITRDLVLAGGGHAHVLALRMLGMQPIPGVRITLVSPSSHTPYSGMLPGLVAGHYSFEEAHIDLTRLCQWAGARLLCAEVTRINPAQGSIALRDRPDVSYDLLSLDTGSEPELDSVPGARAHSVPIKPVSGLWRRWSALAEKLSRPGGAQARRIAVVGGGAGSVELIMAMATRFRGRPLRFALYCGAPEILSGYNRRARGAVGRALSGLDIELFRGARVEAVEQQALVLSDGARHDFDDLFWCTGAAAPPWIAASGLQTDSSGFLAVRDTLQAMDHDNLFAAGDVATQLNHPRPKAGVYAVRQGPVLADNLRSALLDKPLKSHTPQRHFLSLLSLGGKEATADRGVFSATGKWVWRWKDHIDRAFMARFEDLPAAMAQPHAPHQTAAETQMPCGGCGAKVGAGPLARVLTELASEFPEHCPNGGRADDTAALPACEGRAMVQSIDVLREMLADPWLMGRIAANHALSDLYACGARPLTALATITLPFASETVQERELKQLLAGALQEFKTVDCQLLGGHSLQGRELNIGFVVNGVALSQTNGLLGKSGLRIGDRLVLSKALGTGALFAAQMQLKTDGRHIQAAIDSMLQSSAAASRLAVAMGASACTDVTGFGLLGHLLEMLADDQGAQLALSDIPQLAGARACIAGGVFSSMHKANVEAKNAIGETAPGLDPAAIDLLVDPQTSGGLLLGIAADQAAALCSALVAAGYSDSAVIGEVTSRGPTPSQPVVLV